MEHSFQFLRKGQPLTGDLIVTVPGRIQSKEELLQVLSKELKFPSYFGMNWDALSDCLRDFHWLKSQRIVIKHENLPDLPPSMLTAYLRILEQAIQSWQKDHSRELVVAFPEENRKVIENQ